MKRCVECGKHDLRAGETSLTLAVNGREYSAVVPATVCADCGESYVEYAVMERFELRVAAAVLAAGDVSGAAFKFARKALGFTAVELGELLDVTAATISRWETGERDPDRGALAVLATLVRDRRDGREDTLTLLKAMRKPARRGKRVDLGRVA